MDGMRPMRYMGIADAAVNLNYHVTYFSSTFRHSNKSQRFLETTDLNVKDNYDVVYVKSPSYKKHISIKRLWAHFILAQNLMKVINSKNEKPEFILVAIPTLSSASSLVKWAKKNNIKIYADVIDPWPDPFYLAFNGWKRFLIKLLVFPLILKRNFILKNLNGLVAISEEYCNWAKSVNKILPTQAFYPSVDFKNIRKIQSQLGIRNNISDEINLVYAGSFGLSYDLPCILKSIETLNNSDGFKHKVKLHLAGAGHFLPLIQKYMKEYSNIEYHGMLNFEELQGLFNQCDAGLIQHNKNATQTVTYKLFDYLSAGLIIINSLNSEMKEIISQNQIGFNHESSDYIGLSNIIKSLVENRKLLEEYKKNAIEFCEKFGNSEENYKDLINFVQKNTEVN